MVRGWDVGTGIGCLSAGIIHLGLGALGLIIHAWTVIIAFGAKGFIAAVITLALPVVAELFWGYQIWSTSGIFLNWYTISLLAYTGLWILMWVLMVVFGSLLDT
jgi:hypothetical protein